MRIEVGCDSPPASPEPVHNQKRRRLDGGIREDLLECPVCFNFLNSPIYQCPNGHPLCSICKEKVRDCPTCRAHMGSIRCLMLEKVAACLQLPCRYVDHGCLKILEYEEKGVHETNCRHRPYQCVVRGCEVSADLEGIVAHHVGRHSLRGVNDSSNISEVFTEFSFSLDVVLSGRKCSQPLIFFCESKYFFLHFEEQKSFGGSYSAYVTLLGEPLECLRFKYRLEVRRHDRVMTWEGPPRSIREPLDAISKSHDCLVMPKHLAKYFSEGDMTELELEIKGLIWDITTEP